MVTEPPAASTAAMAEAEARETTRWRGCFRAAVAFAVLETGGGIIVGEEEGEGEELGGML